MQKEELENRAKQIYENNRKWVLYRNLAFSEQLW
jgi:hypothetical protein